MKDAVEEDGMKVGDLAGHRAPQGFFQVSLVGSQSHIAGRPIDLMFPLFLMHFPARVSLGKHEYTMPAVTMLV